MLRVKILTRSERKSIAQRNNLIRYEFANSRGFIENVCYILQFDIIILNNFIRIIWLEYRFFSFMYLRKTIFINIATIYLGNF